MSAFFAHSRLSLNPDTVARSTAVSNYGSKSIVCFIIVYLPDGEANLITKGLLPERGFCIALRLG